MGAGRFNKCSGLAGGFQYVMIGIEVDYGFGQCVLGPVAHRAGIRTTTQQQRECGDHHGLTRSGLTGNNR